MIDQIKMGKPHTYNHRKIILVEYTGATWDKSRTLTIAKHETEKTWSIFEEKRRYTGNGMTCEKSIVYYGRDMDLRTAKQRAIALLEDYHAKITAA